jgi:hypothetical protein
MFFLYQKKVVDNSVFLLVNGLLLVALWEVPDGCTRGCFAVVTGLILTAPQLLEDPTNTENETICTKIVFS